MKKRLFSSALFVILVGGFVVGCGLHFDVVHASKEVSGVIDSAIVWRKVDSPFNLTGPVLVSEGAILTIAPGVTVNLNGYYIRVEGTLCARGEVSDKIYFLGGGSKPPNWAITFTESSDSWNKVDGSGCVIENVVIDSDHTGISIRGGAPRVDSNFISGYYAIDVFGGSTVISNNVINGEVGVHYAPVTIIGNNVTGSILVTEGPYRAVISNNTVVNDGKNKTLSGIVCSNAHVHDNVVCGFKTAGITVERTGEVNATIERNLVMYNSVGINVSRGASPTIRYNTVANNSVGIEVNQTSSPFIHYNNIQDNSQNSIYLSVESNDVNATDNWWGTTDTHAINQSIFDFVDDFNLGTVTFVPFLTAPHPLAPSVASAPELTPTPTPNRSEDNPATISPLRDLEIAILALLIVIAGLLVAVLALLLRKR